MIDIGCIRKITNSSMRKLFQPMCAYEKNSLLRDFSPCFLPSFIFFILHHHDEEDDDDHLSESSAGIGNF